jgi:uncharacterized protein YndB with AHSA1/START domain
MEPTTQNLVVRKVIAVNVEPEKAFSIFTKNMVQWWPKEHHIGDRPMAALVVEPFNGGRWYERGEDGSECDWGKVLVYEPPHRVVFSWHLNGDFEFVPDIERASEVEARFRSERPGETTIELEHRHFERHGESGDRLRTEVDKPGGWSYIFENYRQLVATEILQQVKP